MLCSLSSKLDDSALKSIRNLEQELGRTLLAFNCHDVKPSELNDAELSKIRNLEKSLAVSLVAVEA